MRIERVMRAFSGTPWYITPDKARELLGVLELRLDGMKVQPPATAIADSESPAELNVVGGVAVIPIYGTISPRMNMMNSLSGGTSTELIAKNFRSALANDEVKSILLDIDSPGGNSQGIVELADEIYDSRGKKPIVAVANHTAGSAAYYIAAAADKIVISPSGSVGSIGAVAVHTETSKRDEMEGIKRTIVSSPPAKAEMNSVEPLSDEGLESLKELIKELHMEFAESVAKYRRTDVDTVLKKYGAGRMLTSKRALKAGMVDSISTFEHELAALQGAQAVAVDILRPGQSTTGALAGRCDVDLVETLSSIGLNVSTIEEAQTTIAGLMEKAARHDAAIESAARSMSSEMALSEQVASLEATVADLSMKVSERDDKLKQQEIDSVLKAASLKPQAEEFARELAKTDMEQFRKFVSMQSSLSTEMPTGRLAISPATPTAFNPKAELDAKIRAKMKEYNVSYTTAFEMVSAKGKA